MKDNNILFTSRRYKDHHDFWKRQLSSLCEGFVFSCGPIGQRETGGELKSHEFELSEDARRAITRLANQNDLGIAVVLLSALRYLLYRFSDHDVVCVKSPPLNKNNTERGCEDEVLLIAEINGSGTIKDLLANISRVVSSSYRYQNLPRNLVLAEAR